MFNALDAPTSHQTQAITMPASINVTMAITRLRHPIAPHALPVWQAAHISQPAVTNQQTQFAYPAAPARWAIMQALYVLHCLTLSVLRAV